MWSYCLMCSYWKNCQWSEHSEHAITRASFNSNSWTQVAYGSGSILLHITSLWTWSWHTWTFCTACHCTALWNTMPTNNESNISAHTQNRHVRNAAFAYSYSQQVSIKLLHLWDDEKMIKCFKVHIAPTLGGSQLPITSVPEICHSLDSQAPVGTRCT